VEWQYVDATHNYEHRSRADFDLTNLIPNNAVIEKVEVRQFVFSNDAPSGQLVEYRNTDRVGVGNCALGTRFNNVGSGTLYTTINEYKHIVNQYTNWIDLGNDAITNLNSHPEYFVVGTKVEFTTAVDDSWNGRIEWIRTTAGKQPELRITYELPGEVDEELIIENYLNKRTQWFPIFIMIGLTIFSIWWVLK
jgi:hypothetical protein